MSRFEKYSDEERCSIDGSDVLDQTKSTLLPLHFSEPEQLPSRISVRVLSRAKCCLQYILNASLIALLVWTIRKSNGTSDQRDTLFARASVDSPLSLYLNELPLTLGVKPIRIHSHNDEQNPVPLLAALAYGAASIEADVWLVDEQVGHHARQTSKARTLKALYIEPLLHMLDQANRGSNGSEIKGIFEMAPSLPLQLLIDFKTDQRELFDAVMRDLQPLRSKGYLTTFDGQKMKTSAITVIGSGAVELELITAQNQRDLFYDAPLALLDSDLFEFTPSISPMASTNFALIGGLAAWFYPPYQKKLVCQLVAEAHKRGMTARFWGQPTWPQVRRTDAWHTAMDCGADWLNVDNLSIGSRF